MIRRTLLALAVSALLGLSLGACSTSHSAGGGCAACGKGKAGEAVWCESCSAGFVDGQKVKCKGCFQAKTGGPKCAACAKG